jgi:site-specific recombinase
LHVTPANAQDREQAAALAGAVQVATGVAVSVAYVDQGYTGTPAASPKITNDCQTWLKGCIPLRSPD